MIIIGGAPYSSAQMAVARAIHDYFADWGTIFQIAAVANADRETSLNPKAVGDDKAAFNQYQWHWSPRGADILAETGIDVRDGVLQSGLEAARWEFNGPKHAAFMKIVSCATVEDASEVFCNLFEEAGAADAVARSRMLAAAWAAYFA